MTVGVIRVHPGALSDAAEAAERSAERLADRLSDVDQLVRMLVAEWTGAASDGFQQTAARWRAGSSDLHESLTELKVLLSRAHDNYVAAEVANLRMWGTR